jgi:hypothetical protein
MKRLLILSLSILTALTTFAAQENTDITSTEGIVLGDFVAEETMKSDLLQMLANFAT